MSHVLITLTCRQVQDLEKQLSAAKSTISRLQITIYENDLKGTGNSMMTAKQEYSPTTDSGFESTGRRVI